MPMRSLKFVREPGLIYDLFFSFIFYYNKEYCMNHFLNLNKPKEEEYYTNILNDFTYNSEDLLSFFYLKECKSCFMIDALFKDYAQKFDEEFNFSFLIDLISDRTLFMLKLLEYYFPKIDKEEMKKAVQSLPEVAKMIRDSDLIDTVKNSLYSFFIDPQRVFEILEDELTQKYKQISIYYEQHKELMDEAENTFDINIIESNLAQLEESSIDISPFQQITVTFCLLNKNIVMCLLGEKTANLILGFDYYASIEYLYTRTRLPDLVDLGNALSEKNRVLIMDMMLNYGEVTIKDIENQLNYTGTNAYYHVTLLSRAKLIKTRNVGRTIFYGLNKENVDLVLELLGKYSRKYTNIKSPNIG